MVALHQRYYHGAPVTARTQLMGGELLACVMGGVYTDVEKTLIELGRHTAVKETRTAFQNAMQERFISEVQRLSGRRVTSFSSHSHVGPDLEIELFMLARSRRATPDAQARVALVGYRVPAGGVVVGLRTRPLVARRSFSSASC